MRTQRHRAKRNERLLRHERYVYSHLDEYTAVFNLSDTPMPELPKAPATPRKSVGQPMDVRPMDDCERKPFSIFK